MSMAPNDVTSSLVGVSAQQGKQATTDDCRGVNEEGVHRNDEIGGGDFDERLVDETFTSCSTDSSEASESGLYKVNHESVPTKVRIPNFTWSQVLHGKASPLVPQPWVELSMTLDGRDNITKVLQYSARMIAWWYQSHNLSTNHVARFKALQTSLGQSRKAYRLGKTVGEIEKLRSLNLLALISSILKKAWNTSANQTALTNKAGSPLWKLVCTALKLLGLVGFWTSDNISFLASSGFLDNYTLDESRRLSRRESLVVRASNFASRSYFFAAVAGFYVNLRTYWMFHRNDVRMAQEEVEKSQSNAAEGDNEQVGHASRVLDKVREKQLELLLALLKSCCDVMVFSNNPGVDLHTKYRGKKMHDGFHALCGMVSASTVLYSNFPNA